MKSLLLLAVVLIATMLNGCTSLPKNPDRAQSNAIVSTDDTRLGEAVGKLSEGKGVMSGFSPLSDGLDAFAARAVLANIAEKSIDVQYYIWHNDDVGDLLAVALLKAAERGVRVRVLIDDIGLGATDEGLIAFDSHPNLEIRLFNPRINRAWRAVESVFSFNRINRRMHNKSFTVDNQVTIVGGRNVGNEYYDANPDVNFSDFDVMAVGPVAREVSASFDKYWNSEFAIPVAEIIKQSTISVEELLRRVVAYEAELMDSPYVKAVKNSQFLQHIRNSSLPLYWGEAHVLYDDPEKLSSDSKETHLLTKMTSLIDDPEKELIIISPYFIPGNKGVEDIATVIAKGASVKILTNSLSATDVGAVHAGYAKYRIPLLKAGTDLYEAKPDPAFEEARKRKKKSGYGGSSRSSLHSKVYVFDRNKVFVGSMNLDPRSTEINTELGILFENSELAAIIGNFWDNDIKKIAYELKLQIEEVAGDWGPHTQTSLIWLEHLGDEVKTYTEDPKTGFWRRFGVKFLGVLPIENQL
ncbi:phospholipase D family protein [Kaarinaea lacus]